MLYTLTFGRNAGLVLLDGMNSMMESRDRMADEARLPRIMSQYAELFARMVACWQRVLYLSSPRR